MAAKSSIRDTARVLDLPLHDADRIAKLIPNMSKLNKIFGVDEKVLKSKFRSDDLVLINELLNISEGEDLSAQTVNQARVLEGSVRNTGIHACGVVITPDDNSSALLLNHFKFTSSLVILVRSSAFSITSYFNWVVRIV